MNIMPGAMVGSLRNVSRRKSMFIPPGRKLKGQQLKRVALDERREEKDIEFKIVEKPIDDLTPSLTIQEAIPALSEEEYQRLKGDIGKRGIQVPIEINEDGKILCGHHRWRAAKDLGFETVPCVVKTLRPEEMLPHAVKDNLFRRQLTKEQRDALIAGLLEKYGMQRGRPSKRCHVASFRKTDDEIAKMARVSKRTVRRVRAKQKSRSKPAAVAKHPMKTLKQTKRFEDRDTMIDESGRYIADLLQEHAKHLVCVKVVATIKQINPKMMN